jgi:hypothetical protein
MNLLKTSIKKGLSSKKILKKNINLPFTIDKIKSENKKIFKIMNEKEMHNKLINKKGGSSLFNMIKKMVSNNNSNNNNNSNSKITYIKASESLEYKIKNKH